MTNVKHTVSGYLATVVTMNIETEETGTREIFLDTTTKNNTSLARYTDKLISDETEKFVMIKDLKPVKRTYELNAKFFFERATVVETIEREVK